MEKDQDMFGKDGVADGGRKPSDSCMSEDAYKKLRRMYFVLGLTDIKALGEMSWKTRGGELRKFAEITIRRALNLKSPDYPTALPMLKETGELIHVIPIDSARPDSPARTFEEIRLILEARRRAWSTGELLMLLPVSREKLRRDIEQGLFGQEITMTGTRLKISAQGALNYFNTFVYDPQD